MRIWDSLNYIEIKNFHEHKADVLALCASNVGKDTLYATGVDSKIIAITKTEAKGWVYTSCTRGQSHDISSLLLTK